MPYSTLITLLEKFINESATPNELSQLRTFLKEPQNNAYAKEWIEAVLAENRYASYTDFDIERMFDEVLKKGNSLTPELKSTAIQIENDTLTVKPDPAESAPVFTRTIHRVHFLRNWFRYAAAVIIVFATGAYFWNKQQNKAPGTAQKRPVPVHDVTPGGNRAILTLSDGSTIVLDSAAVGQLALQGSSTIQKTANGEIIYTSGSASDAQLPVYNTMATPRGGQYSLALPDGSRVWLNAASSITYPTVFAGNERKVSITGEAYFEVAKDKHKPFIVNTNTDQITVLGTSFNVNAYNDERPVKTTLLEGSVKIDDKTLKPGEAYLDGRIIKTDVTQDVAWKNGVFNFHRLGLKEVMTQLERWYDIEVVYDGSIPRMQFYGEMGRDLNLSQVLKGLEGSGVNFSLEQGKRIIVKK